MKKYLIYLFTIISLGLSGQSISLDNRLQSSRLILGSNANMLDKGNILLYNIDILYSAVDFGLTKNLTVGAGFIFRPGGSTVGQLKMKLGHSFNQNVHIALTGHLFHSIPRGQFDLFTPIYVLTTLNYDKYSLTFGPGIVLEEDSQALSAQLALVVHIKEKLAFISENYWGYDPVRNTYNDNWFLLNLGLRLFRKNWFFDFAVSNIVLSSGDGNGILPVPTLSANYKFD